MITRLHESYTPTIIESAINIFCLVHIYIYVHRTYLLNNFMYRHNKDHVVAEFVAIHAAHAR